MRELFNSTEFILLLVVASYVAGLWIFKKSKLSILNPLLVATIIIIAFLKVTNTSYETFEHGSRFVSFLLGPSVVALGYVLYEQFEHLKKNFSSIFTSVFVGSLVGIFSVIVIAKLTGANHEILMSLEPKSVTTPIAISISKQLGGNISITAIVVLFCGIYGAIIAQPLFKIFRIKSPIAKGLALGASSHGVGTSKAIEMGRVEGAMAGLAIGVMGVMTAVLAAILKYFIQ